MKFENKEIGRNPWNVLNGVPGRMSLGKVE